MRRRQYTRIGAVSSDTAFVMDLWRQNQTLHWHYEELKHQIDKEKLRLEVAAAGDIEAPSDFLVWLCKNTYAENTWFAAFRNPNIAVGDIIQLLDHRNTTGSYSYKYPYSYEKCVADIIQNPAFDMMSLERPGLFYELLNRSEGHLARILADPVVAKYIGTPKEVLTFNRAAIQQDKYGLSTPPHGGYLPDEIKIYPGLVTVTYYYKQRTKKNSSFRMYPTLSEAIHSEPQMPKKATKEGIWRHMTDQELIALSDQHTESFSYKEEIDGHLLKISALAEEADKIFSKIRRESDYPLKGGWNLSQEGFLDVMHALFDEYTILCGLFKNRPSLKKLANRLASFAPSPDFPVEYSDVWAVDRTLSRIRKQAKALAEEEYTLERLAKVLTADTWLSIESALDALEHQKTPVGRILPFSKKTSLRKSFR